MHKGLADAAARIREQAALEICAAVVLDVEPGDPGNTVVAIQKVFEQGFWSDAEPRVKLEAIRLVLVMNHPDVVAAAKRALEREASE